MSTTPSTESLVGSTVADQTVNFTTIFDEDHLDVIIHDGAEVKISYPPAVATAMALVFLGYLLLGVVGNLLTVLALARCPRVRNVTAAFIISLCTTDLLFCVLVLPWEMSRFLFRRWLWGEGLVCTLFPLIRYWNVAASLLSIAMITINRYIMIAHHGVYSAIYRPVWIALMIAFCWAFPFAMLLPTLLGMWGRFGLDGRLDTCSILSSEGQRPKEALFALGFCVPAIVIVVCYSLIFRAVRRSERRVQTHRRASTGLADQGKSERERCCRRNEWRVTQMVLTIFLAFLLTYLPITLVKIFDRGIVYPGLHLVGYLLIYMSCCVNPVIYAIMNRQYRQAYKSVLLCRRPRLTSFNLQSTAENRSRLGAVSLHKTPVGEREAAEGTVFSSVSEGEVGGSGPQNDDIPMPTLYRPVQDT